MVKPHYVLGLLCTLIAGETVASEIRISAFADGTIKSAGVLGVSADTTSVSTLTARSGGSNINHAVYLFDLSAIPRSETIESASVELTTASLISNTNDTAAVKIYGFGSDETIRPNDFDQPASEASLLLATETFPTGATNSPPINTVLTIPFTNLSPLEITRSGNQTLMLRSETENFVTFRIHSLENELDQRGATLVVKTVPEPDSSLFFAAIISIACLRRRWLTRPSTKRTRILH